MDLTAHLKSTLYGFFRTVPCHRREERCFHIGGEAMPICSRCLFILIGMLFLPPVPDPPLAHLHRVCPAGAHGAGWVDTAQTVENQYECP
ncbi:DUF2085 domain-containing protein [Rossellomorea marisflavi]|uniref:DUF2085 domain-containing protein n=1 Tax=Rossellomorea marisflavi TaxID=189381 RepID=UPI001E5D2DC7|nr:DUF2085 domain-containing protein [Rossellomorea marisflavi]